MRMQYNWTPDMQATSAIVFIELAFFIPLGADKTYDASDGIFNSLLNDRYNENSIVGRAFKFVSNQQQPRVCSYIRLKVMLI